jgi:hypothetical protein
MKVLPDIFMKTSWIQDLTLVEVAMAVMYKKNKPLIAVNP